MDFGDCVSITDFICICISRFEIISFVYIFGISIYLMLCLTLSHSIPYTNGLIPYALNVIPLDLFCLSGISCRVIDYGQFSKHPTANTWSISLLFFINVVAVFVVVFLSSFYSHSCSFAWVAFWILPLSFRINQPGALFYCSSFHSSNIELKIQFNWFCWLCLEIFKRFHSIQSDRLVDPFYVGTFSGVIRIYRWNNTNHSWCFNKV